MKSVLRNRSNAAAQVREGGVMGLIATPEQREVLGRVSGLMSLLEGHGDVTMTRAAGDLVPNAPRFERILHERRRTANPLSRVVMRLAGIEAKLNQYAAGAHFIESIEAANGLHAVDVCWMSPTHLPTMDEIKQPYRWLGRTGALVG
jgi:putative hydrolase